jgi:hypothetical protein
MNGRGGEIRTRDLYVPNVAPYQAKLRPDDFICPIFYLRKNPQKIKSISLRQTLFLKRLVFVEQPFGAQKSPVNFTGL